MLIPPNGNFGYIFVHGMETQFLYKNVNILRVLRSIFPSMFWNIRIYKPVEGKSNNSTLVTQKEKKQNINVVEHTGILQP